MKTDRMRRLDEFFQVQRDPERLFLEKVCIVGVTSFGRQHQPKTKFQLYDLYVRTTKLFHRYLAIELNFAFDDDGNRLSDHQLFLQCPVSTLADFSRRMDQLLGAAHNENRTERGLGYPNLIVKDLLVYWLHSPQVRAIFGGFDAVVQTLDRVRTAEDSLLSVDQFDPVIKTVVKQSLTNLSEKTALAVQESSQQAMNFLGMAAYAHSQHDSDRGAS